MVTYMKGYNGKSITSCPNYSEWEEQFREGDEIFAVTISSNLSGSYNAANLASQDYPDKKICVIDSISTGGSMLLIVEKIRQCEQMGKTFEETAEIVKEYVNQIHIIFTLESMANLANNGRVSHVVAKGAELFGIRLIGKGSEIGKIEMIDKAKGKSRAMEKSFESMKKCGFTGRKAIIDHVLNEELAIKLKARILEEYPGCDVRIGTCGGLCSFYAEQGGIIVGFE